MQNMDVKVLRKKKLDKEASLVVFKNEMSGRIFVQFTGTKLTLEKSFQDTHNGREEAEEFAGSIKSMTDLRNYFGIGARKNV